MQGSDMKRFLLNILIFFLIIALFDVCIGFICDYLQGHARGGVTRQFHDLMTKDCHDIIILGSSRARQHYDPMVMEQELKMDCYNAGYDGNGVILAYPILVNMLDRCKPKLVICDFTRNFDIMVNPNDIGNTRYISRLKPYYRIPVVGEVIKSVSHAGYIQVHSGMYRHNSTIIILLMNSFLNMRMDVKGFAPLRGKIAKVRPEKNLNDEAQDPLKLFWLRKLAELKDKYDLKMVWAISPQYFDHSPSHSAFATAKEIAASHGIPFLDYYFDPSFVGHKDLFRNTTHLNSEGAKMFTERFVKEVKPMLE